MFANLGAQRIKELLVQELKKQAANQNQPEKGRLIGLANHLTKRNGDKAWLINTLATIDFNNELDIFKPDYDLRHGVN